MVAPALLDPKQENNKEKIIEDYEELEFQIFRMQENMKEIAKKWNVLGIDQTRKENWIIIYASDDGNVCKIMAHDCNRPFLGKWDFSIHAHYKDDYHVQIDDIRGEENRGYGSVCMKFLKEYTMEQNVHTISGNISDRDWDHVDRLVHFYKKHRFHIDIEPTDKSGKIYWTP
ncbi:hypothetical protein CR194_06280 [Salipaludibacillus keqinensis]|uniref:N-acetyltransferase domain-containing protein n=1 Tax=Salipaludibacillus keqinensis TaxID=2045207 RepID=A0A323TJR2_9BACI|nr:hypothetical protein [Salipaludibacillus keqinensis]PYZ95118.1 hypothetical protein CR194_06280 [Salipaludibacillus keqinensis]